MLSRFFPGKLKRLTCTCFQVEDCKMNTVSVRNKASAKFLKLNGTTNYLDLDPGDRNQNYSVPPNTTPLEIQVAGHSFGYGKNTLGGRNFFCLFLF